MALVEKMSNNMRDNVLIIVFCLFTLIGAILLVDKVQNSNEQTTVEQACRLRGGEIRDFGEYPWAHLIIWTCVKRPS